MSTDTQSLEALVAERARLDSLIRSAKAAGLEPRHRLAAQAISDAMGRQAVSIRELAKRLKIAPPAASRLVRSGSSNPKGGGKFGMSVGLLCRIADALDCDVSIKLVPRGTEREQ